MGKFMKFILSGLVIVIIGFIWYVIDWHSPRHFIKIIAITDASIQKEGDCEFVLPAGNYVIVVSNYQPGFYRKGEGNEIRIKYLLEVPSEEIRIEREKVIDLWFAGSFLQDEVVFRKHKATGHLKVEVISPPKGKVSIGLASNRYAGM